MKVISIDEVEHIERDYGLMKILAGGNKVRTSNVDLRILEIEPKRSTSKHYHAKSESIFYILAGRIEVETSDSSIQLDEGAIIVISPNEVHVLRNIGQDKAIVIEAMAPPFSKSDIFYL